MYAVWLILGFLLDTFFLTSMVRNYGKFPPTDFLFLFFRLVLSILYFQLFRVYFKYFINFD